METCLFARSSLSYSRANLISLLNLARETLKTICPLPYLAGQFVKRRENVQRRGNVLRNNERPWTGGRKNCPRTRRLDRPSRIEKKGFSISGKGGGDKGEVAARAISRAIQRFQFVLRRRSRCTTTRENLEFTGRLFTPLKYFIRNGAAPF